ncbi:hypothetical protein ID866_5289 [Astraeus odoratus]|nr:hypothetical protein ID866_5289 [Astraeus odoratus]
MPLQLARQIFSKTDLIQTQSDSSSVTDSPTSSTTDSITSAPASTTQDAQSSSSTAVSSDPSTNAVTTTTATPSTSAQTSTTSLTSSQHLTSSTSTPSTSAAPSTSSSTSPSPTPFSTSGTPTTSGILSTYVTVVSGSTYTTLGLIPTTVPPQPSSSSDSRAAIIGGSAAGAAIVIICLVSVTFFFRRKRVKRLRILDAITSSQKQAQQRAMLLAGEDLDDIDMSHYSSAGRYRDFDASWDVGSPQGSMSIRSFIPPGSPGFGPHPGPSPLPSAGFSSPGASIRGMGMSSTPTFHQSRRSDTGSLFQEDVWPPPNERSRLVDPLMHGRDIDLSRIVDDVMGPSASSPPSGVGDRQEQSAVSSVVPNSGANTSHVALLEAAGLSGPSPASESDPLSADVLSQGALSKTS